MLSVEGLRVRYGAVEVLKGISLEVGPREIVALLGANGAGKTTTLMAISGLVPADGGTITFSGSPIHRESSEVIVARGLVQVPEGRRVFARMTVEENLRLGAFRRHVRSAAEEIAKMCALFPVLGERRRQLAGTLSGGEQQMLALARGLMARPSLLLLDEPSLGLAPKVVAQLFAMIQRINREDGVPILLVEQNAYQALHIAQRGYVLSGGRITSQGPTDELLRDPAIKAAYLGG